MGERLDDSNMIDVTSQIPALGGTVLAGLANAAIARRRGTSARTVANQVASIFRKLGVQSRAELAARWGQRLEPRG